MHHKLSNLILMVTLGDTGNQRLREVNYLPKAILGVTRTRFPPQHSRISSPKQHCLS